MAINLGPDHGETTTAITTATAKF